MQLRTRKFLVLMICSLLGGLSCIAAEQNTDNDSKSAPKLALASTQVAAGSDRSSLDFTGVPGSQGLHPGAVNLARQLKLEPVIERLHQLQDRVGQNPNPKDLMTIIRLSQLIDYRLTVVSLQIEDVLAQIDAEASRTDEMHYTLDSRRQRALKLNALANLVGSGGVGVIANSVGISNNTDGNIIGTIASAVNASFAAASLWQQRDTGYGIKRGQARPNMLAQIFNKEPTEDTTYPPAVWAYLNESVDKDSGKTRRQALIDKWVKFGRIGPSLKHPKAQKEIDILTGTVPQGHVLTIENLDDRSAMLADLRAVISGMKRNLLKIMISVEPTDVRIDE